MGITDDYVSYCVNEAVDWFGVRVESTLEGMKKGQHEKAETFASRKEREFLRLMGQEDQIKYANPVATR